MPFAWREGGVINMDISFLRSAAWAMVVAEFQTRLSGGAASGRGADRL